MGLHYLDIFAIAVLLIGMIRGLRVGIVGAALAIVGMVLAIYLSIQLHHEVALWLKDHLEALGKWTGGVAFLLIFVVTLTVFHYGVLLITRLLDATPLGMLNRVAGGLFFMAGMAMVVGAIAWGLVQYGWVDARSYADTVVFKPMVMLGEKLVTLAMEGGLFDRMDQLWKEISHAMQSSPA